MPRLPLRFPMPALPSVRPVVLHVAVLAAAAGTSAGVLAASLTEPAVRPAAVVATPHLPVVHGSTEHDRTPVVPHVQQPAVRPHPATPAPHRFTPHAHRARTKQAPVRWVPTGTGIWIYQWAQTNGGNPQAIVQRALQAHLATVYVRTGSSWDGFTGGPVLRALLPATRGTALRVVAWDFPRLVHPKHDAARLAQAAWFLRRSGVHVSAVAPDIETRAEGTHLSPAHVNLYLKTLRAMLPADVGLLGTVPWPSQFRVGHYPYAEVAARSDAMLPMAYWYDNSPVDVTATSIRYLSRFHRPVLPVGQGYDGRIDVPSLPHNNLRKQVPAFFATAHRLGARGVSLWSWQAAPPTAWLALRWAHTLFPAH